MSVYIQSCMLTHTSSVPYIADHVADLLQHCWFPFGIDQVELSPAGGIYHLGSSDASLEVPQGAIDEKLIVQFGIALHGPFIIPKGYSHASVSVYLFFGDTAALSKPVILHLSHWCLGNKLKFAQSTHLLNSDMMYIFDVMESGVFQEQKHCGSLQIKQPQTIYTILMEEGEQTACYAMLLERPPSRDSQQYTLLVHYYSSTWIQVREHDCTFHLLSKYKTAND